MTVCMIITEFSYAHVLFLDIIYDSLVNCHDRECSCQVFEPCSIFC